MSLNPVSQDSSEGGQQRQSLGISSEIQCHALSKPLPPIPVPAPVSPAPPTHSSVTETESNLSETSNIGPRGAKLKDQCFLPFLQGTSACPNTSNAHAADLGARRDASETTSHHGLPHYSHAQSDQLAPLYTSSYDTSIPVGFDPSVSPVDSDITNEEIAEYKRDDDTTVCPDITSDSGHETIMSQSDAPTWEHFAPEYLYAYDSRRRSDPFPGSIPSRDIYQDRLSTSRGIGEREVEDAGTLVEAAIQPQEDGTFGVEISVNRMRSLWDRTSDRGAASAAVASDVGRRQIAPSSILGLDAALSDTSADHGQHGASGPVRASSSRNPFKWRRRSSTRSGHSDGRTLVSESRQVDSVQDADMDPIEVNLEINRNEWKKKGKGKQKMGQLELPPMSIVIFIVGSRGDVQPYVSLALSLIIGAGHRVRLATHPDFREFVLSANSRLRGKDHRGVPLEGRLEFFDVGGNPKELMAYMVKNPGILPGISSVKNGDIKRKRTMTAEYLRGFYRSTFSPDIVSGKEFAADAIISNPPAFAHIHVAEALGIPLLMSFTMPWTATTAFPHPLVNVTKSNTALGVTNWIGYHLTDVLIWEGLSGVINEFRTSILRLPVMLDRVGYGVLDNNRVPWTYCWSPELLLKPKDWDKHIEISGFYFLDSEDGFQPPADLVDFLRAGPAPVYVGFGSVVISEPEAVTDAIFQAVKSAGLRAIVSAGWAGLGKGREDEDPDIFVLSKDCPHEWLFAQARVAAVCHHGGAGTTSCGLRHGRPTVIVPFFGDQKFWGDTVYRAGAGPAPIPIKYLTMDSLASALQIATSEDCIKSAAVLGQCIREEQGEERGVRSFTRNMPSDRLCCDLDPRKVAIWSCSRHALWLSAEGAAALLSAQLISFADLEPYRTREYDTRRHGNGPFAAAGAAVGQTITTSLSAPPQLLYSPVKGVTKVLYGIPNAIFGIVADIYEGFDNIPLRMGSTIRRRSEVHDWKSGMIEGWKVCFQDYADAISSPITDPIDGALREGFVGFGKGIGRGFGNLLFRPCAGTLAFFVLPTRGIRASIQATIGHTLDPHSVLRGPKEALTREAMKNLVPEYKRRLLDTFAVLCGETKKRRRQRNKIQWLLIASKKEREAEKEDKKRTNTEREARKSLERRIKEEKRIVQERLKGKDKSK